MKKVKSIRISEEKEKILDSIIEEHSFKSNGQAIEWLIDNYSKSKIQEEEDSRLAELFLERFSEKYYAFFERLRWATRTAEKNSIIMLDAINTMLINQKLEDCINIDSYMSPVISTSETIYKEKITHFKQEKDNRKSKR